MRFPRITIVVAVVLTALLLAGCAESEPDAVQRESERRDQAVENMDTNIPSEPMDYSSTLAGIEFWKQKWGEEGKLAYIYFTNNAGEVTSYAVIEGLPVSYCASRTPPYKLVDPDDSGAGSGDGDSDPIVMVPAPAMDGAYYSGGQCLQFYAKDALTDAYIEWSIGGTQNYMLYDQPLEGPEVQDIPARSNTTIEEAQQAEQDTGQ